MSREPDCLYGSAPPIRLSKLTIESCTNIGMRTSQEDRILICPRLSSGSDRLTLCCVFDGTVGFEAAEFCQQNLAKYMAIEEYPFLLDQNAETEEPTDSELDIRKIGISNLLRRTFLDTDNAFIEMCKEKGGLDFSSSTGVAVFLWPLNMVSIAHVGDSRACLARMDTEETMQCEWLTVDHKADHPLELKRIQENGGSLVYLHGNKPFIRGGDFLERQALGQHPKQLNYSRAFGGKDLKPYGLSVDPSVSHRKLTNSDKFILIGSDGLWDTLPMKNICEIAWKCYCEYKQNPARNAGVQVITNEIISAALKHMPLTTVRDNISVVAIFFELDSDFTVATSNSSNIT